MSLLYAEKLSFRADVGALGMPEFFDSPNILQSKITELAKLIRQVSFSHGFEMDWYYRESKHLVVFTGAGISTSCGIPDFRGPNGVWTLKHEGKPMPDGTPFHQARPGLTHMALVGLQRAGLLKYIISQNIDGLHLRSGIPRAQLAELHGNCFREVCGGCGKDYVRDFEMDTVGLRPTGRRCSAPDCGSKLLDTIVDWEDALPPSELKLAEKHSKQADVILCLGTSLQITPACNLPMKTVRAGGKMVIVNLQATPKDKKASLVIHARVDEVIREVLNKLQLQIPPYVRVDCVTVSYHYVIARKKTVKLVLQIESIHGPKAPMPFLESVEATFPEQPEILSAKWSKQPFILRRVTNTKSLDMLLTLEFGNGSMCATAQIRHTLHFEENLLNGQEGEEQGSLYALRAADDAVCGQVSTIQIRKPTDGTLGSIVDFGIVTSVVSHARDARQESADGGDQKVEVEGGEETNEKTGANAVNSEEEADDIGIESTEDKTRASSGNGRMELEDRDEAEIRAGNGKMKMDEREEEEEDNTRSRAANGARKKSRKS